MDDANKSRLYPCALFYVQGVTDNHNFLTISVDVAGDNATVKGMQGAKRRTRKFEIGVPFAYTVGSLTMKEAPAGATTVDFIQEEVKEGRATTEGSFMIDGFLTDASDIAEVVGLSSTAEAETIIEPADMASPMEDEPTPSGYEPESYEAEIDDSVTVSDFYPQESAQTHDVASGHGVPVAYGSGSSQNLEPPVVIDDEYMAAEEFEAEEMSDEDYLLKIIEFDEKNPQPAKPHHIKSSLYEDGTTPSMSFILDGKTVNPKVMLKAIREGRGTLNRNAEIDDSVTVSDFYPQESAQTHDVSSGHGVPVAYGSGSSQNLEPPVVVDEEMAAEYDDSVEVSDFYPQESAQTHDVSSGHGVPVAYGSGSSQNLEPPVVVDEEMAAEYQKGRRGAGGRFRSKKDIRNEVFGETVANQMAGYWRTGVVGTNPVVGSDVARSNQDKRYKYFTEPAVRNENTGMFNKGPNFRQAHKIAKGVAWDRVQRMGLAAEAEVLLAESKFETLASKIAKQYEKKGMEPGKAMDIGRRTAYKVGVSKYGKAGMTRKAIAGRKAAESYSADRFVDSLNEAAPARLPIKGIAAALVGTLLGVGYAMKK